jgi:hypothetical protein
MSRHVDNPHKIHPTAHVDAFRRRKRRFDAFHNFSIELAFDIAFLNGAIPAGSRGQPS